MKTLFAYAHRSGQARVRLVERPPQMVVQPMAVDLSYAVIVDVANHYATFSNFPNIVSAAAHYVRAVSDVLDAVEPVSLEGM